MSTEREIIQIYKNTRVPLGRGKTHRLPDGTFEVEPPNTYLTASLIHINLPSNKTEACNSTHLELQINNYLTELAFNGAEPETIEGYAQHLKAYVIWLIDNHERFTWDKFGRRKLDKPTYQFWKHLREQEIIKESTARARINVVKAFYEHVIQNKFLNLAAEKSPFKEKWIQRKGNYIHTSDLAIKVTKKTLQQRLNPLTDDEYDVFITELKEMQLYKSLPLLLMVMCGLRIETAASFPSSIIHLDYITNESIKDGLIKGIVLSKENLTDTKNDKPQDLYMPPELMRLLYRFKASDLYQKRSAKFNERNPGFPNDQLPLFISQSGTKSNAALIYSYWKEIRDKIRSKYGISFKHKPHELRATFATRYFRSAMESGHLSSVAIQLVSDWLGHESTKTTLDYVRFVESHKEKRQVQAFIDQRVIRDLNSLLV